MKHLIRTQSFTTECTEDTEGRQRREEQSRVFDRMNRINGMRRREEGKWRRALASPEPRQLSPFSSP
jgi:hypothetical protein